MKTVAILFCGMPRYFERCYQSHLQFFDLDGYQFDYFIHCWEESRFWYDPKGGRFNSKENLEDRLKDIYNPKKIEVESQEENFDLQLDFDAICRLSRYYDFVGNIKEEDQYLIWKHFFSDKEKFLDRLHAGQLYSLEKVTNLKKEYENENNIRYDKVIRFRLDNVLDKHTDSEKDSIFKLNWFLDDDGNLIERLDEGAKESDYVIFSHWCSFGEGGRPCIGDMFFGGSSYAFDCLCQDVYRFLIKSIMRELSSFKESEVCGWVPEAILAEKIIRDSAKLRCLSPVRQTPYRSFHLDGNQDYETIHGKYLKQLEGEDFL